MCKILFISFPTSFFSFLRLFLFSFSFLSFITRGLHSFLHFPFTYSVFDHKFFNSPYFVTVSCCSDNVSSSVSPTSFTVTYPSCRLIHCFLIFELGWVSDEVSFGLSYLLHIIFSFSFYFSLSIVSMKHFQYLSSHTTWLEH